MKQLVNRIANIIFLTGSILLWILVIVNHCKIKNTEYSYMASIGENWNKGPLIKVDPSGRPCSGEFQRIIANDWPGTTDGCYCENNIELFRDHLGKGRCVSKFEIYFCQQISQKPPMMWEKWRGVSLCANRVQASYLDLTISSSDKGCPMNMKPCGKVDSLNNFLCVPQNSACPINKIFIGKNQSDMNYTSLQTNPGTYISFSNEDTKGNILNELYISDLQPCADPSSMNYQGTPYLLDPFYYKPNCNDGVGQTKFDNRYNLVDQYSYSSQIKDNNVLPFIATLPLFKIPNNELTGLYSRNYIGVNPSCIRKIRDMGYTTENIISELLDIKTYADSAYLISFIIPICVICFILIIISQFLVGFLDKDEKWVFMLPSSFSLIAIIILSFFLLSFTKTYGREHDFFLDQNCVDTITYTAAQNFYPKINSVKDVTLMSIILSIFLLVKPLYQMVDSCCN